MSEPTDPYTRFGLIRHAKTLWNLEKRIQGQADSALSDEGQRQALGWRIQLESKGFERILASDLGRTRRTAAIVNRNMKLPQAFDPRLREQDWGDWVGLTVAQIRAKAPDVVHQQEAAGWRFCPPQGEDRIQVKRRSLEALDDAAMKWPGETILLVAHEGVVKCLLYHLTGRDFLPTEEPLIKKGYHLHWLAHDGRRLMLEKVNGLELGT